jgi:hypothetical protein
MVGRFIRRMKIYRRTHALRSRRISLANVVSDGRDIRDRAQREPKLHRSSTT